MAWTSPRTWVAGEIPTAANFNTHLRDNMKTIGDSWTAFTPTWTATTTNPVIGNGTIVGAYTPSGKLVHFWVLITMGSTTTQGSGTRQISLPVLQNLTPNWLFNGVAFDTSANTSYPLFCQNVSSSLIRIMWMSGTFSLTGVTSSAPFAWATGDTLSINGTYEAA